MKARVLLASIGISIALAILVGIGISRGVDIAERVSAAYYTNSIDEYVGGGQAITQEQCESLADSAKAALGNSSAPGQLTKALEKFEATLDGGEPSSRTYGLVKSDKLLQSLNLTLEDSAFSINNRLKENLEFDAESTKQDVISRESQKDLDRQISDLDKSGRLPFGVSTASWPDAHLEKYQSACGEAIDGAVKEVAGDFETEVLVYAEHLANLIESDWTSPGYEKISPLVAYDTFGSNYSCSSYYGSCAKFYLEVAAPCTVDLIVEFTDSYGSVDDVQYQAVKMTNANSRKAVEVATSAPGGGFYDITEAICR